MLSLSCASSLMTSLFCAQKQSRGNSAEVAGTVVWFGSTMLSLLLSVIAQHYPMLDRQEFTTAERWDLDQVLLAKHQLKLSIITQKLIFAIFEPFLHNF